MRLKLRSAAPLIGCIVFTLGLAALPWVVSSFYWHRDFVYATCLGFAILGPLFVFRRVSTNLWVMIAADAGAPRQASEPHHRKDLPLLVGVIERALFLAAWLVEQPAFIGVWLALKIAGGWEGWSRGRAVQWKDGDKKHCRTVTGRHIFNVFLIGSGLSVVVALVAALGLDWLKEGRFVRTTAVWSGLQLFLLAFWWWSATYRDRELNRRGLDTAAT